VVFPWQSGTSASAEQSMEAVTICGRPDTGTIGVAESEIDKLFAVFGLALRLGSVWLVFHII
ncbi:MAG: hypothetical protein Q4P24_17710, partial [Rhodobacterales bacterium]|nr:hypothetical protein [Rhodobacterales bacterium]